MNPIPFTLDESKKSFIFTIDRYYAGKMASLKIEEKEIVRTRVPRKGKMTIPIRSEEGEKISEALDEKREISIIIRD